MMRNKILLILLCVSSALSAESGLSGDSTQRAATLPIEGEKPAGQRGSYLYADATQLWRLTQNAAGMELDFTRNRGFAQFRYEHEQGDYSRVQEGNRTNQLRFETERYQRVGKHLYAYGRFEFDYGRQHNRAWCDVMRPYNATPYFAGSSIEGKYDFQDFDFTAALGTRAFGRWRFGLSLDYKVGDLSRLRDPRSRSQLLDYKLTPGVTYQMGKHTLGLSGAYHRRKEKITGVKTVQSDATFMYYLMSGMEHANGTVGGYSSYWREWVDHRFVGELTYGYKSEGLNQIAALYIERGKENAYGTYKYEPGTFTDYRYGMKWNGRVERGSLLHEADVKVGYRQSFADEYRQELQSETDPTTGVVSQYYITKLIYKKRYQVKRFEADVHYRLNFVKDKRVRGYAGAEFSMNNTRNTYLLPYSSLHYDGFDITIEGGLPVWKERLWFDASATLHLNKTADLNLNDPTTDYALGVLIPDMTYYGSNYGGGTLGVTYQFPLTIKKTRTMWYVKAEGSFLRTNHSQNKGGFGVTLGIWN